MHLSRWCFISPGRMVNGSICKTLTSLRPPGHTHQRPGRFPCPFIFARVSMSAFVFSSFPGTDFGFPDISEYFHPAAAWELPLHLFASGGYHPHYPGTWAEHTSSIEKRTPPGRPCPPAAGYSQNCSLPFRKAGSPSSPT